MCRYSFQFIFDVCESFDLTVFFFRPRPVTAADRIVIRNEIEKELSSTIIILGDGAFDTTSPGHEPLPSARKLYFELQKRGIHVIWQDEFRTSKLCSGCHS